MTVPTNVQDWTGNGPNGCFTLHGGDTVPSELEASVPDSWRADKPKQSTTATPVPGPAPSTSAG